MPGALTTDSLADGHPAVLLTTEPLTLEGARERPAGAIAASAADEALQTWNIGGSSEPNHVSNRPSYHPGTRVRVDAYPRFASRFLRSPAGVELTHNINGSLRSHGYWPFRICYENEAREHPDRGGKTTLRLTVDPNGNVLHAKVLSTDLRIDAIARCHAVVSRRLHINPPLPRRRFDVDVIVSVWPGDIPLLASPPSPELRTPNIATAFAEAMHELDADVARCMAFARRLDPLLWGRLALSFALREDGVPTDVLEYQSRFSSTEAVACVADRLYSVVFPAELRGRGRLVAAWRLHRGKPADEDTTPDSSSIRDTSTSASSPID